MRIFFIYKGKIERWERESKIEMINYWFVFLGGGRIKGNLNLKYLYDKNI